MITKDTSIEEIQKLAPACSCEQCNHGCKLGSGFLAKGDKEKIASFLKIDVKELEKKYLEKLRLLNKDMFRPKLERKNGMPFGKCNFFKDNKCSIHSVKPLECKIAMGCREYGEELTQWFMLNHILDINNKESIREYASYLKSGGKTLSGGELKELIPDKKKLKKMLKRSY